ncbi:MAG TPA: hypothetical protein VK463_18195 [Desulfomonilaceae bacterium]|nr:hypothetical protein [Desulfomonilaceae bacterium]
MNKPEESHRSPLLMFSRIRSAFLERGLLGASISVEYAGRKYRVSCDEKNFMVYRVNENSRSGHHLPGWPVCLVNSHTIFEECSSPGLGDDHYTCDATLEKWLDIVNVSSLISGHTSTMD